MHLRSTPTLSRARQQQVLAFGVVCYQTSRDIFLLNKKLVESGGHRLALLRDDLQLASLKITQLTLLQSKGRYCHSVFCLCIFPMGARRYLPVSLQRTFPSISDTISRLDQHYYERCSGDHRPYGEVPPTHGGRVPKVFTCGALVLCLDARGYHAAPDPIANRISTD